MAVALLILTSIAASLMGCKGIVSSKQKDITAYVKNDKLLVKDNVSKSTKSFKVHGVTQISIAPSGKKIAFWSTDRDFSKSKNKLQLFFEVLDYMRLPQHLNILDIETGKIKKYAKAPGINDCKWSQDSKYLFTSRMDVIYAINADKAKLEFILEPDYDYYTGIAFNDNLFVAKFANSQPDDFVNILIDGKLVNELEPVKGIAKFGDNLLTETKNKLQIIQPLDGKVIKSFDLPEEANYSFISSPGGEIFAMKVFLQGVAKACFDDGFYMDHVRVYDDNFKLLARLKGTIEDIVFIDDTKFYYVKYAGDGENIRSKIYLYNTKTKKDRLLGKYEIFDWLTEKNKEARIFKYPKNTRMVKTNKPKNNY